MTFNQWKLLNLVKEIVTKSDKSLLNPELTNEFLQTIQKLSAYTQTYTKILQSTHTMKKLQTRNNVKDLHHLPEIKNKTIIPNTYEQKITPKWKVRNFSEVSNYTFF